MIHSIILYWMSMYTYFGDVIWSNGREGGYLVLGNMVYTVNISQIFETSNFKHTRFFLLLVCGCDSLSQSRSYNKFMDVANALQYMGFYWTLVPLHVHIQVKNRRLLMSFINFVFAATFGLRSVLEQFFQELIT